MITVFTPTFNRKYIICKLFDSLLAQTSKNFEWLVVDDGSTDNTKEYFEELLNKEIPFNIKYVYQKNGGKHRAINKGVNLASGDLFFIVDSDDFLAKDAVEKLEKWAALLPKTGKWAGVAGLKGRENSEVIGGRYDKAEYIDATNFQREKYNLIGDKAEAYFVEVLKKFPFPEFENEKFITEEVVWNAIAFEGYKLRWFNEVIYYCDYLSDGLTRSGYSKYKKSPLGTLCWTCRQIKYFGRFNKKSIVAINCYIEAVKDNKGIKQIAKDIGVSSLYLGLLIFFIKLRSKFKRLK